MCDGNEVTDFTFECGVKYKAATDGDVALFDVVLTFDGVVDESTAKTVTSVNKTVVFNSTDLAGQFGKQVNYAIHVNRNIIYIGLRLKTPHFKRSRFENRTYSTRISH